MPAVTEPLSHPDTLAETHQRVGPLALLSFPPDPRRKERLIFEQIVAGLDFPMFIVTVATPTEMSGCLVGFASQCSIDPFRFLICLSKKNRTFEVASDSDCMAVHVVPLDQWELANLFGGETGDEVDKFDRCEWSPGPGGVPVLEVCPSWFAGSIISRVDGGDHVVHMIEPTVGNKGADGPLLTFQQAREIDPGHEA